MYDNPTNRQRLPLALKLFVIQGAKTSPFYKDLAEKLGISVQAVKIS